MTLDKKIRLKWQHKNGASVKKNETICTLTGPLASLLKGERTALNFLGHLSGIATLTSEFVQQTLGTPCKILDTRKTLPGLRGLEKKAVLHGGGVNHRLNLSVGILIKENHIRPAGGITAAVERIRKKNKGRPIRSRSDESRRD